MVLSIEISLHALFEDTKAGGRLFHLVITEEIEAQTVMK